MSGVVLDLFRGAGGWSVAAQRLGLEEYGVEIDKAANATAEAAGFKTAWLDVWEPDFSSLPDSVTGLIASPPCQTFSQAGKGSGRQALDTVLALVPQVRHSTLRQLREKGEAATGDERTALVLSPLWYALTLRPEWVCFEQVPTVLPVWEAMAEELRQSGYSVWTGILHAEQYGVPQTRKRAFLIASRTKEVEPPKPTHSRYYPRNPGKLDEGVEKWVSMAEALNWGLRERPAYTVTGGSGHAGATGIEWGGKSVREAMIDMATSGDEAWEPKATDGGVRDDLPEWAYERPSTTVVGTFKPEIVASPGYRTTVSRQNALDSVRVTVQEAGVLQSFPADYPWQGAKGRRYLQAGNAVPPLLAEAVIRCVSE